MANYIGPFFKGLFLNRTAGQSPSTAPYIEAVESCPDVLSLKSHTDKIKS